MMTDDTISRQEAINSVLRNLNKEEYRSSWESGAVKVMKDTLEKMPTADRPQGKWIVNMSDYKSVCSVCGANETHFIYGTEMWYGLGKSKFCPYCGARMKGA